MMSLGFLYFFLPLSLILFYIVPGRMRSVTLLFISLCFFILAEPQYALLFTGSVVFHYILTLLMKKTEAKPLLRRTLMVFGVTENVAVILWFSVRFELYGEYMPLGTMVLSVTALGMLVDIYKHDAPYSKGFIEHALFLTFFPKLYTGPLVRFGETRGLGYTGHFSLSRFGDGIKLFIRGLAKYVLLYSPLNEIYLALKVAGEKELSVFGAWLITITLAMTLFFRLSGFCDMARGVGTLFGVDLPKNFYYPFQSPSVTDFLDRFNMTVTQFFRHYVYDNLQSEKNTIPKLAVNTALICMLSGLWFGIRTNYICWGLYIAFFIVLEELFLGDILRKIPRFFARVYTFAITMLSMVVFSADSPSRALAYSKAMIGLDVPLYTNEVAYITGEGVVEIVVGALLLTSTLSMISSYIRRRHPSFMGMASSLSSLLLLLMCTAVLLK